MLAIYGPLDLILSVVYFVMIVHIIMSWLINFQVLTNHFYIRNQIPGRIILQTRMRGRLTTAPLIKQHNTIHLGIKILTMVGTTTRTRTAV